MIFTILAIYAHPFYYSFHLLEFIILIKAMKTINSSIWIPKNALIMNFLAILMANYFFTLFGYYWFYDLYAASTKGTT